MSNFLSIFRIFSLYHLFYLKKGMDPLKTALTIITNSAFIADHTRQKTNVRMILLGGIYQPASHVMPLSVMTVFTLSFRFRGTLPCFKNLSLSVSTTTCPACFAMSRTA